VLHSTNNFPEFTGRICPAPCEASCTLNIVDDPVTIKSIECAIVDRAWQEGWILPRIAEKRTGRTVAIVGGGPAGLACAQQLARVGHDVTVFEKNARVGGLLRYGIPDFKMEKHHIDRRIAQMEAEGVTFRTGCEIGKDVPAETLIREYDAVVLAGGSEWPRDLEVPGRELDGIHFAMDFLTQQNRRIAGEPVEAEAEILATDKHVIVIGGGDTGSDCIGTSWRQGARSVTQLEIMPRPPQKEGKGTTWPEWPLKLRTSSSQEEGGERDWSVATERFTGRDGRVAALHGVRLTPRLQRIEGTEFELEADLVLLAMGFVHPVQEGMLNDLAVAYDRRGNVAADTEAYRTSVDKVFSAGDMRRGQSLVVWAIREGRQCARAVDAHLMGDSDLPR
jgi:glutamate synthase (NADPH) small chain